ncbi:MAG: ZmpA/ZmpB/ZmpC family metallo-endopeptidase [Verrucomicrobiota bacterium]
MKSPLLLFFSLAICMNLSLMQNSRADTTSTALDTPLLEAPFMQSLELYLDSESYKTLYSAYETYISTLSTFDVSDPDLVAATFTYNYLLTHESFAIKAKSAILKTLEDIYEKNPSDALKKILDKIKNNEALTDEDRDELIEELKKQIDDLKNLTEEERQKAKDALEKLMEQNKDLLKAISDAQAQYANALGQIAQNADKLKPQQMDPMQMMMMLMMMMMMMMQMKQGGGCQQ